ncbi:MAG TPA: hypothetical protein VM163_09725 [bacterium]|nr:hypothetical protein [bacterium]
MVKKEESKTIRVVCREEGTDNEFILTFRVLEGAWVIDQIIDGYDSCCKRGQRCPSE